MKPCEGVKAPSELIITTKSPNKWDNY